MWSTFVGTMVDIIGGGLTQFATKIGGGLKALVEAIFVTITPASGDVAASVTISTLGGLILAFAGLSLAFSLSRWVLNFCTSLGARNR